MDECFNINEIKKKLKLKIQYILEIKLLKINVFFYPLHYCL